MVEHAVELEDVWTRHVFPDDHLPAKALVVKSACVRVVCFPLTTRAHLFEFYGTLLI